MPFDIAKFKSKKPTRESVEIDECGTLYVHALNVPDRMAFQEDLRKLQEGKNEDPARYLLTLMVHAIRDEQGQRLFSTADIEAIEAMDGHTVERLAVAAHRLNNPDPADSKKN